MRAEFGVFVAVPIEEAFAFFDDPVRTLEFQEQAKAHFQRADVIEVQPDGRRTIDLFMRAGTRQWVQTIVQEVRQPPTRQVGRSYTWTNDRSRHLSSLSTDRRFATEPGGTRINLVVEFNVERQRLRPVALLLNQLWGNRAFQVQQEHALHFIAEYLEERHRATARVVADVD